MSTNNEASSSDERMEVDPPILEQQDMDVVQQNEVEDSQETGLRISDDIYIPPPPQAFGEYDTTGPRMMIVKIITKNFKSYAGSVLIGPFDKVCIKYILE